VAMVLIFLRGQIPEIFGIFLANVILLFSASACFATVSKFYETAFPVRRCMAVFAAGMAGLLLWLWGGFSLTVPTVTVCVALSAILFDACALIVKKSQRPFSFSVILLASTLGIMAAMYCFRAVVTVLAAQPTSGTIGNSASQLGVLIVGALFIVSSSIGFFVMVHEHQRNLIEALTRRDVLTGVLTRRAFFEDATRIAQASDAYAVLMIDIDHFKSINDSFGHLGGDKVLAHCARLLMNAMRIDDVLGRYGGEEFCAILPNCGLADAQKMAQSIVQQIREQNVMLGEQQIAKFSLSIGVAAHQHAEDLLATIKCADEALYAAKNAGRDRVCVADAFN
jgi:diguanylate cyclase (GGDEF)-like protein